MSWTFRYTTFNPSDWNFFARYWHPVAFSRDVKGAPVSAKLLEQELVIYRGATGVTVARDLCLHRGVRLSRGRMEGCELVCPYHGFRYDGTGQCTLIPAQDPSLPISSKLTLQVYPSIERYGLIWTCLQPQGAIPDLPAWEQFGDPAWQAIPIPPAAWQASATRQTENFNDVAHLPIVHVGTFGVPTSTRIPTYTVSQERNRLRFEMPVEQLDRATFDVSNPATIRNLYCYDFMLPFASRLWIKSPDGRDNILFNVASPVTAKTSRIFVTVLRNYDHDQPIEAAVQFEQAVAAEDRPMVEDQRPEELPLDLTEEVHIYADRFAIEFRKLLVESGLSQASFS